MRQHHVGDLRSQKTARVARAGMLTDRDLVAKCWPPVSGLNLEVIIAVDDLPGLLAEEIMRLARPSHASTLSGAGMVRIGNL